jgi:HAD superfamily hydrolase (TIGR01490 family)
VKLAIFDIDGTITRTSSERFFIKYLLRQRKLTYVHLLRTFFLFVIKHPLQARTGFKQNKMYLRNLKEPDLRKLAAECFNKEIISSTKRSLMDEIERRRSEGYKILLLSGSLPCLVEPMVNLVKADFMICSEVENVNSVFTGEMKALHPYGENKKTLAEKFCKEHGFDMMQSCAYANEWADRFLLEATAEAIAVDPDGKLKRLATTRNWKIID